jgi:iron complex outermembrane receptor protein
MQSVDFHARANPRLAPFLGGKTTRSCRMCALGVTLACALAWQMRSDPAHAQAASSDEQESGQLQEVVVSAQFREENLQRTPIAISAFTSENIEARGISSVTDAAGFVPNAVIQPLGAGWGSTIAAYIRGVGLGDNILSFEPGVPIYIDDVYFGRPQGAIFDLLDLERIEVLRGPQGTLFGKNAIGGTVRLISKKPTGEGGGYVSAQLGSRSRFNLRAMTDFTIVPETVFARLAFSSKRQDGYFDVLDYECVNGAGSLTDGGPGLPAQNLPGVKLGSQAQPGNCVVDTLGDEDVQSGRAALRWIASDRVEFNLIGDLTVQRQKGPADKYTVIDPTALFNPGWNSQVSIPVFGVPWDARFITDSAYTNYSRYGTDPLTGRNVPNINDLEHWGLSLTGEWRISENVQLKSVTAYRRFWNKFGRDSDGSPIPINHTFDHNRHRQFTQEFQLTGTSGPLTWATGLFYYDAFDENRGWDSLLPPIGEPDAVLPFPAGFYKLDNHDQQETKNWAVFVHGTWQVSDPLSITAGLRYTDDEKDSTIFRADFDGTVVIPNAPVRPESTRLDQTLSFQYEWHDGFMTYVKYSTGFRGGGFGPRPQTTCQINAFGPEKLKNYEIGAKSEPFDRRVRLNGAVFYSKYTAQQNFEVITDPCGGTWFHTTNTGKSRIWGVEGELQAEPIEGLRIEASLGYINYYLQDPENSTVCQRDVNGDVCYAPRTPKWNGALGIQYAFAAPGGSSITPRLDALYQSKITFLARTDPNDTVNGFQEGYTLLNGHITWHSAERDWEVGLYGLNLTDKEYFLGKLSLVGLFGREQGNVAPPREIGITIKRAF